MKNLFLIAVFALVSHVTVSAQALTPIEELGKNIFFDRLSAGPPRQACASCHHPSAGWTGGIAGINIHGAVYPGAEPRAFGNRKPPSSAYATFSPNFYFDSDTGEFIGGNLWDGRATGWLRGSPTADQALGPFAADVEQNISLQKVCMKIQASKYAMLFEQVWGPGSLDCTDSGYLDTGDRIALSIAAYEASAEVIPFSSRFDDYWRVCLNTGNDAEACGKAEGDKAVLDPDNLLTEQEFEGLVQFGEYCSACHVSHEPGPDGLPPVFSSHEFDNIGVPRNPENPVYEYDPGFVDLGLGGFLDTADEWAHLARLNDGKMKIPTVRNVAAGLGEGFTRSYMHNGVFKSLEQVVHFYNTRDVPEAGWPPPEVEANVNRELFEGVPLGDLQLPAEDEAAIVAFLATLTDRVAPGKPIGVIAPRAVPR